MFQSFSEKKNKINEMVITLLLNQSKFQTESEVSI